MDKITLKRLKDAGWNPDRKVDISSFIKRYQEIGLEMPWNVQLFLEE